MVNQFVAKGRLIFYCFTSDWLVQHSLFLIETLSLCATHVYTHVHVYTSHQEYVPQCT